MSALLLLNMFRGRKKGLTSMQALKNAFLGDLVGGGGNIVANILVTDRLNARDLESSPPAGLPPAPAPVPPAKDVEPIKDVELIKALVHDLDEKVRGLQEEVKKNCGEHQGDSELE